MEKRQKLNKEQKQQICKERFEDGKSTNELEQKYNVCQRSIIRISNEYRKYGKTEFALKLKIKECDIIFMQRKSKKNNL